VVVFAGIAIPDMILTVPIIAAFAVAVVHFIALYRLRVPITFGQSLGSVFAAMAMQWTVARAVSDGLVKDRLPFARTAKGGRTHAFQEFEAFWEAIIGSLLVAGAILVIMTNYEAVRELNWFAAVLIIQSLPFLSAVGIALLERTRVNEFAFWRSVEGRILELLPRRVAQAGVQAPTDKRVEPVP
jgi:hypothetical protein